MRAIKQITPRLDATIIAREVSSMLWSNYFLNKFTYRVFHDISLSVHIIESFLWFFTEIFHNRSIFFGYVFIFFFEWRYPAKKTVLLNSTETKTLTLLLYGQKHAENNKTENWLAKALLLFVTIKAYREKIKKALRERLST